MYTNLYTRTLFVRAQRNLTALGVWPIKTYSPEFRQLWSGGPVITMWQHASVVLHFPMFAGSFRCSFYSLHYQRIRCKLCVQVPCITQWFLQQHVFLCFIQKNKNSSGDETANVNFLYDDTLHALQNIVRC